MAGRMTVVARERHRRVSALTGAVLGAAITLAGVAGAGATSPSQRATLTTAKTQLLTLADFPTGWTSAKNTNTGSSNLPGRTQLAHCLGVSPKTLNVNPPKDNSLEFNAPGSQTLSAVESIAAFASTSQASKEFAAISSSKLPSCYGKVLNTSAIKGQLERSIGNGAKVSKIKVIGVNTGGATGFTATFTVSAAGRSLPFTLTDLFAVNGTEGMDLEFTGLNGVPSSLVTQIATTAVGRL